MAHAIIRGKNGRRYEVDFEDSPVRVEVHASEETIEIFVEADFETHAEERRRFAIINISPAIYSARRPLEQRDARQRGIVDTADSALLPYPWRCRLLRAPYRDSGLVQKGMCDI